MPRKKRESGKKAEDDKPAEEAINSSDDELLRAAEALEKVVTVSDEEWMEAGIDLEKWDLEEKRMMATKDPSIRVYTWYMTIKPSLIKKMEIRKVMATKEAR